MARERKYEVQDNSAKVEALVGKANERGFTLLQSHFADWVTDNAAPEFKTAKERDAFRLGAAFALVLRMEHQRSPENHEFKAENAAARQQEADAKPARKTRAAAPAEVAPPARTARRGRTRTAAADTAEQTVKAPAARRPAAAGKPGRPARRASGKAEAEF